MKEVKIGFIGCGGNANGHMNQLAGIEGRKHCGSVRRSSGTGAKCS